MSNSERWDHSGFEGLIKDEKNNTHNNQKRNINNKKPFYKYKDSNQLNEKTMFSDYIDNNNSNRKNQNKQQKYYNKSINDQNLEMRDDKIKQNIQDNNYKSKNNKKKKKDIDNMNTYEDNNSEKFSFKKSNSGLSEDNYELYEKNNTYVKPNLNYQFNPNFYNKNLGMINNFQNNAYPNNINNNFQNFNYLQQPQNNIPNYTITVTEAEPQTENFENGPDNESDQFLMQQTNILYNETNKNKKNFMSMLDTLKANRKSKQNNEVKKRSSDSRLTLSISEEGSNGTPNRKLSGSAKSNSNTFNLPNTPPVNVNFPSPVNKDFYVPNFPNAPNMIKMPNNYNYNSPLRQMNEQYIYPQNFQNNTRNMNPQMMGMMGMGLSPIENMNNFNPGYNMNYNMMGMNQMNKNPINKNYHPEMYRNENDNQNNNYDKRNMKKYQNNNSQFNNNNFYKNKMMNNINNISPNLGNSKGNNLSNNINNPIPNNIGNIPNMTMGANFNMNNNYNNINYNNKKLMMPNMTNTTNMNNNPVINNMPNMNMMYRMKPVKSEKNINNLNQVLRTDYQNINENIKSHKNFKSNYNTHIRKNLDKPENINNSPMVQKYYTYNSLDTDDKTVLQVVIKLLDKEEIISLSKYEDTLKISKEFCNKHNLNEDLVKPLQHKIKQALKSIDLLLDHNVSTSEERSLIEIQNFYNQFGNNESFLNNSCITDLGSDKEDFLVEENIQLNMSK